MSMLIVCYSHTGNNKFIAQKIAEECKCDIEEIHPIAKSYFILLIATLTNISIRIKSANHQISEYNTIVLCGPIWMGQIAAPVLSFIKKYFKIINCIYLVSCCASTEDDKKSIFGYLKVFEKIKGIAGNKLKMAYPVSIGLTVDEAKREETNMTEVRLNDTNFTGKIKDQYKEIIKELKNEN